MLKSVGGQNTKDAIVRMFLKAMSDNVGKELSWIGLKGTRKFQTLELSKAMFGKRFNLSSFSQGGVIPTSKFFPLVSHFDAFNSDTTFRLNKYFWLSF